MAADGHPVPIQSLSASRFRSGQPPGVYSRTCARLLCPRLALLPSLILLAGLAGCGPTSSGDPANVESHTGMAEPSPSEQVPVSGNVPTTPTASPVPLASGLAPAGQGNARPADKLVVPPWMATALENPDVRVRLRVLDAWGQSAPTGSVAPLILALEDEDERVRKRALALIEQDWVREQAKR